MRLMTITLKQKELFYFSSSSCSKYFERKLSELVSDKEYRASGRTLANIPDSILLLPFLYEQRSLSLYIYIYIYKYYLFENKLYTTYL